MIGQREDALAWNLVERYRHLMTARERTAAFVYLGADEYRAVIHIVLTILAAQHKILDRGAASEVQGWIDSYDIDAEFGALLARAVGAAAIG